MESSILLRIASALTLIFCVGHSYEAYDTAHTSDPAGASGFAARLAGPSLFREGEFGCTVMADAGQYAPHFEGA